jgi:hypothetical protein
MSNDLLSRIKEHGIHEDIISELVKYLVDGKLRWRDPTAPEDFLDSSPPVPSLFVGPKQ